MFYNYEIIINIDESTSMPTQRPVKLFIEEQLWLYIGMLVLLILRGGRMNKSKLRRTTFKLC